MFSISTLILMAVYANAQNNLPDFAISSNLSKLSVCNGSSGASLITVNTQIDYTEDVTLSITNIPSFINNEMLSDTVITVPDTSNLIFDTIIGATPGVELLTIKGEGIELPGQDLVYYDGFESDDSGHPTISHSLDIQVTYSGVVPEIAVLTSPVDMATRLPRTDLQFSWQPVINASGYLIEIALDSDFNNIVEMAQVDTPSYVSQLTLTANRYFYWRVKATNDCGQGIYSSVFTFKTTYRFCFTTPTEIPDNDSNGVNMTFSINEDVGHLAEIELLLISDHTWPGDLTLTLSNNDVSVLVMDRPGVPDTEYGCETSGIDATFSIYSPFPVEDECSNSEPGISGFLSPTDQFDAFAGSDFIGDWALTAVDNAEFYTGKILQFCIFPIVLLD